MNAMRKLVRTHGRCGYAPILMMALAGISLLLVMQRHANGNDEPSGRERTGMDAARQQYVTATTRDELRQAQDNLVNELRAHYSGIDASVAGPDVIPHEIRFTRLMRDWSPIFFSVAHLKAIAGDPTRENATLVEYVFDNGLDASAWRFKISGGTIIGVEYIPGE